MKKILIIGAGFLQDFVICKAKELGYETYVVDANPNAVGFTHSDYFEVINIVDQEACLAYAREKEVDGVLTAATDFGVLTAAYIAQEMGLPGLKYEVAQLIKDKYRVRKCLLKHHVDDSVQVYEVTKDTDIKELASKLEYPVMVKPCDGSGSRGATRVDDVKELENACIRAINESIIHKAEIESFIVGKEYGVESLVTNGEILVLGIMKKWMTNPPYYAELGHAIPCGLCSELENKIINCVKKAIKVLGINHGSVNMDLLITEKSEVYIIDIGARMGGNMIGPCVIPYGTGFDYMGAMIKNALNDPVDYSRRKKSSVATRLLAFEEGIVKKSINSDDISKRFNVEIYHHMEKGQHVNEYHTNLDGCGYIVAKADDIDKAIESAENALDYLKDNVF